MANRYYSDVTPSKGTGKKEATGKTQKKSTGVGHALPSDDVKFTPHPDNVRKPNAGFGNKGSTKQRRGQADRE